MSIKKEKPSKVSLRESLFPNISPYIDFTSCVHNHHIPMVIFQYII